MVTASVLDWMRHSISLTVALCNIPEEVRQRSYPCVSREVRIQERDLKRQALEKLQFGASMTDEQQRYANFLLAYADAHVQFYGSDRPAFEAAMAVARGYLKASDERQIA
jgi:hypothetical protein